MRTSMQSLCQQAVGATVAAAFTLLLSGCGIGTAGSSISGVARGTGTTVAPGTVSGGVHGGQQPIAGATMQLYEVGTTGYTTGMAKPLIASSNQSGAVSSVTVTAGGSGYTSAPTVSFSGGGGSGAAGTAVLSSGAVTSVTITSAGSGYTSAPSVSFSSGGGSGAAGSALIVGSNSALTDANGNFSISGDYNCDSGAYVYIAASGGNPGGGSANPNVALIAALGSCSALKANAATTSINIDEVTTVAAAYAMAQFTGNSTFGTPLSSQPGVSGSSAPSDNFTTSSTNTQGIANAMAIAQVLASTATGTSPGSNSNGSATPEYWAINTIANIIAACVNSVSPFTPCTSLYSYVNPFSGSVKPADTLQAALALAQSPIVSSTNITNLYNLISTNPPFLPDATAAAQISDFTVAIAYNPVVPSTTTTLLTDPQVVTFDQYGNAWLEMEQGSTSVDNYVVELDPTGNPIPAGCTSSCTSASNYKITAYTCGATCWSTSTAALGTGATNTFQGVLSTTNDAIGMAFDTANNLWVTDWASGNVAVVPGSGAVYTSSGTATTNNGGNAGAVGYAVGTGGGTRPTGLAIDGSNDVFMTTTGGTYETSGTGYTNIAYTSGGTARPYKGFVTFVGGSPSTVSYAAAQGSPTQLAISSGTLDTVGGTAITGSPFVWSNLTGPSSTTSTAYLDQLFSKPTTVTGVTGTGQGLFTPYSSNTALSTYGIGGPNQTAPAIWTTIPDSRGSLSTTSTLGNPSGDTPTAIIAGALNISYSISVVTDGFGNVWTSSLTGLVDADSDINNVITKITPSYTAPVYGTTAGAYDADFNYVVYHDEAGFGSNTTFYNNTTVSPRFLAADGSGNIWIGLSSGFLGAITNSGVNINSNSSGFAGISTASTGCTGVCYFTGTTTGYSRVAGPKQIQIDQSGNVWAPQNRGAYPNLTVLVGAATPVSQPASAGFAAGSYGLKP